MATIDSHSHDKTSAPARSGVFTVLRLHGEIDLTSCPDLDSTLRANGNHLVVDLSEVTLLSAAAIGVLVAHAQRLADNGGHLRSISGNGAVRKILRLTRADQLLTSDDEPAAAAIGRPSTSKPAPAPPATNDIRFRSETLRLRGQLRTQPTIGRAMGMLQERYRLRDGDTAFGLLKASSQRHNVRLHLLAEAFVTAPRPHSPTNKSWFPGRLRRVAPPLWCASHLVARGTNRTAVLDALLHAAMECMDTSGGDLHTLDRARSDLRLERHRGLPSEFLDFFAARERPTAASRLAFDGRTRVVIADIATDPVLTDPDERSILLAVGSRSMQSSPLSTGGRPVGTVSTYHAPPGQVPTATQRERLDVITTQVAAWLEWHHRTVVLDALEQVHQSARAAPRSPRAAPRSHRTS